ncbi:hypothetical protein [Bradyrhizobium sp.]|uniref:hypothetical protein n=1 Tax=Bradyrhizobium sp. TaxID=376 RepID=UPI0027339677|nr:hypothetical protein [Bradyrhizobium sp.]MDP3693840.1 hypothetical protein [Bradyrhizobium sp.]
MIIKASGCSALIVVTALLVCFAGPSQAAPDGDTATASPKSQQTSRAPMALNKSPKPRQSKQSAQRKSSKALKSQAAGKVTEDTGNGSTEIAPSIANANAQLPAAEPPAGSAKAMSAQAGTMLQTAADRPVDGQPAAEPGVVAPDQLNDLDRALQEAKSEANSEAKPAAPILTLASAEAPPAPAAPVVARSKEDSAWDQTSLIGKIFIAFGALLTMASAARMFMA